MDGLADLKALLQHIEGEDADPCEGAELALAYVHACIMLRSIRAAETADQQPAKQSYVRQEDEAGSRSAVA